MMDWDGIIVSAGWDIDLDGHIDYPVSVNEGYTTLRIQFSEMIRETLQRISTMVSFSLAVKMKYNTIMNKVSYLAQLMMMEK